MDKLWHTKSSEDIIKELNSSEYGISNEEALSRLKKYGLNKLPESKVPSVFVIFFSQFKSSLIYILLVAGVAIFLMGERIDSLKIEESALTGESEPKHKISEAEQNSGERTFQYKNIVYKGTSIVAGNGRAIVIATGQETIIGSIAKKISVIDTEIPLKNNIRYLSRLIIVAI